MNSKISDLPQDDRPRERLALQGANSLRDSELIAILLRTGLPGKSAVQLGDELLRQFGGLHGIAQANCSQLARIKGVGPAKAVQLKAAFEIGSRLGRQIASQEPLDDADRIYALVGDEMQALPHESVRAVLVNSKLRLLAIVEISRGLLDQALLGIRELFREAVLRNAYGLVLVHNHPSGDPTPSEADIRMTATLHSAAKLLNVPLIDHVIIGRRSAERPNGWFSFKSAGLLS